MKKLITLSILIVQTIILNGQVPKYALMEHFTNTLCGVCGSANPAFYQNININANAKIHHISIHSSIPYPNCVFYQANKTEQDKRASFYSLPGTPRVSINGASTLNTSTISSTTIDNNYCSTCSPLEVKVTETSGTNRTAAIQLKSVGSIPSETYRVYVALVEKTVNYNAPNSETVHHNVFRRFLTSSNGDAVTLAAQGNSVNLNYPYTVDAAWVASEVYVVVWVQSVTNNAVLNSGTRFDVAPALPSVAISSNATTICAGTSVTFNATPTNGGASPTYQWKKNGNNVGTNSISYIDNALVNGDVVACVITSTSSATSNSITVTVNPSVPPSVSITSTASNICAGTSTSFTASPTNGGTTPSYQWKKNGNNVGANSISYTDNTLENNDVITCILTSNASCASTTMATSNGVTITVSQRVTPSVSISSSASNICAGTSTSFTASPTNGGTTPSYQWKKNGNNVGTNSISYTDNKLENNDVVTCILTSNASCASTTTATSNGVTITVSQRLTPSISISSTALNICAGTSTSFTASPTNGGSTPSYQWKKNGNNIGNNSISYTDNTLVNNDVVSCVLTSNESCASSTTATSNRVTLTVSSRVTPSVSISSTATNICAGTSISFTASPTNGGTTPSYQWKKNGNNVGTNSISYTDNTLVNNDVVSCILTSNESCASSPTATSNRVTLTVSSSVTPSVSISSTATNICAGTSTSFTATPANGGSSPIYQWKKNGANVGTNSISYTDNTLTTNDVISCILTSNASCASTITATSNRVMITVSPNVTPMIAISSTTTTVTKGAKVTFTATAINGGTMPTYQWKKSGNNVGTNTNTYLDSTLVTGDLISCVLTSNAICKTTPIATSNIITLIVNPTTGIKQGEAEDKFKVFPVPATEVVIIQINDIAKNDFTVILYDLTGKMIETKTLVQGNTIVYFDTHKLYSGQYIARISNETKTWIKKVIVVK